MTEAEKEYQRRQQELLRIRAEQQEQNTDQPSTGNLAASIAFETGLGVATDTVTAFLGWAPPAYALANFASGAVGNLIAQRIRGETDISLGELLASGALGVIPGSTVGKTGKNISKVVGEAGTFRRAATIGSVSGIGAEQIRVGIDEQKWLTPEQILLAGSIGGAMGVGVAGTQVALSTTAKHLLKNLKKHHIGPVYAMGRRKKIRQSPGQLNLSDIPIDRGESEEALTQLYLKARMKLGDPAPSSPIKYVGKEGGKIARKLATRKLKRTDFDKILAEYPEIPEEKVTEYIKSITAERSGKLARNENLKLRRTHKGLEGTITFLNEKALTKHTGTAEEIAEEISVMFNKEFTVDDLQKIINQEGGISFKTEGMTEPVLIKNFEDLQKEYLRRLDRYQDIPAFEEGHIFAVNNIIKDNNIDSLANFKNNLEAEISRSIYKRMDDDLIQQLIDFNNLKIKPKNLTEKDFIAELVRGNRSRKAQLDPDRIIADLYGTGYGLRESFLNYVYPERSLNNLIPADLKEEFAIRYREELQYLLENLKGYTIGPATADKLRLLAVNKVLEAIEPFEGLDSANILTKIINTSRISNKTDMVDPTTGLLRGQ